DCAILSRQPPQRQQDWANALRVGGHQARDPGAPTPPPRPAFTPRAFHCARGRTLAGGGGRWGYCVAVCVLAPRQVTVSVPVMPRPRGGRNQGAATASPSRPSSAHMPASSRSSCSSHPLAAASWNIAWNSVESIVGTFSATHLRLKRCGTLKIATDRHY